MKPSPDLVRGALEPVILEVIAGGATYGYEIAKAIEQTSGGHLLAQEGTLYPLLSKLRREGLVDYQWRESDAGPPRKYYSLTAKGRAHLGELDAYWKHINKTISQLGR